MRSLGVLGLIVGMCVGPTCAEPIDDVEEERAFRGSELFSRLDEFSDGDSILASFEKAFQVDPEGATELLALTAHANDDVAYWASRIVGRYGTGEVVTTLTEVFRTNANPVVRAGALGGLLRSQHTSVAQLAFEALEQPKEEDQVLGLVALEGLGDAAQAAAIVSYLDSPNRAVILQNVFETLAALGDPPGSTLVRDRLAIEANSKANDWGARLEAARALKRIGAAHLAQVILDRNDARFTYRHILGVEDGIREVIEARGTPLESQSDLEAIVGSLTLGSYRLDAWGREIRVTFVDGGGYHVLSDGPDHVSATADDLSSAETFKAYDTRIFADLF